MNDRVNPGQPIPAAGLCGSCRHAQVVVSARGSHFLRCGLSAVHPRFPKYPPLPVVACDGYERAAAEEPTRNSGYD